MASKKDTKITKSSQYMTKEAAGQLREKKTVIIEHELEKIEQKHGVVTPVQMLEEARNPSHALHRFFEWDDTVAAEKYRLTQATHYIMATKYVVVLQAQQNAPPLAVAANAERTVQVRKLLPLSRGGGQVERDRALADQGARAYTVETKLGRLRGWCREASDIEELAPLREAIEAALAKWSAKAA